MYLKYFNYIWKHKFYTFIECCKMGIPIRGLLHDNSKFSFSEFRAYAAKFYSKVPLTDWQKEQFLLAWNHHQKANKHQWQYWVMPTPQDPIQLYALPMPPKYRKEMLADWIGMAKTIGLPVRQWYSENRDKIILHPQTRQWVEATMKARNL